MKNIKRIIGLCVAVMMYLVVFSVLSGNTSGDLEKPIWGMGDKWVYNGTSTEAGMNGTISMEITGTTTIIVNGTNYDVYVMKTSINATLITAGMVGNVTANGTSYWLRSNLAGVKTVMDMNVTFTYLGTEYYMSSSNTTTYNPPVDSYHFPVSVGETWTTTATATSTEVTSSNIPLYQSGTKSSTTTETKNYSCLCTESVTVPAGAFNAYKIKSQELGSNKYEMDYISSDVGFMVKTESYNETGQLSSTQELISYSYVGAGAEEGGPLGEKLAGIPILYWLVITGIVIIVVVLVIVGVALKRKKKAPIPPSYPPQQLGRPPMPPTQPQYPQAQLQQNLCPYCRQTLAFNQQYQRWYCYKCQKYVD